MAHGTLAAHAARCASSDIPANHGAQRRAYDGVGGGNAAHLSRAGASSQRRWRGLSASPAGRGLRGLAHLRRSGKDQSQPLWAASVIHTQGLRWRRRTGTGVYFTISPPRRDYSQGIPFQTRLVRALRVHAFLQVPAAGYALSVPQSYLTRSGNAAGLRAGPGGRRRSAATSAQQIRHPAAVQ